MAAAAAAPVPRRRIRKSARNTNNTNAVAAVATAAAGTQRQGRKRGRPRAPHPPVLILPVPSNNPLDLNAFVLERGILDPLAIRYLFKKELKFSDVSSARRIVIPKKFAETFLPTLEEKEGFFINMDDTNGRHVWSFKFRYWPNNHSRMYLLEHTGEFIETHGLSLGDVIYIYKDERNNRFVIEAQKCAPPLATLNLKYQADAGPVAVPVPEPLMPAPYFPIINDDYFMGDSTTTFGDFPIAALSGGSLPDMPPLERVSSFGSLSFSIEDFP